MKRRHLVLLTLAAAASLAACSGPYSVSADVSSYGTWPAGRAAGSYAFERLPSQQQSKRQAELEDSARAALEKAGFKPATDAKSADVLVSLGAQTSPQEPPIWDDPLWWRWGGGPGYGRFGAGIYWRYGGMWRNPGMPGYGWDRRYEREVAVLLRDRQSNEPLFETHASNDGATAGDAELMGALFSAAMSDFPEAKPKSHRVTVQVQPKGN